MIAEFERYHGVALRSIIVSARRPVTIESWDEVGRIDSYRLNIRTAVHIKHSAKRLAPWQFTFTDDELGELSDLRLGAASLWLVFVCGLDGLVALSDIEFAKVAGPASGSTPFIRIDRDRRLMYRVFGNAGKLPGAKANGVEQIIRDAFADAAGGGIA